MYRPQPAKQDEGGTAIVKSLYICETPGCGIVHERKARFCSDHALVNDRAETIAEHERLIG